MAKTTPWLPYPGPGAGNHTRRRPWWRGRFHFPSRVVITALLIAHVCTVQVAGDVKLVDDETVITHQAEAMAGSTARLPCDLQSPIAGDKAHLVIWYKDDTSSPIYSYDAREKQGGEVKHWFDPQRYNGRISFKGDGASGQLTMERTEDADGGMYRCRVDFGRSPTRNARVNLTVILPPEQMLVQDSRGDHIRNYVLGPYNEGDSVDITCVVTGGRPQPQVTWWMENALLDESYERVSERKVQNVLHLENLSRRQLNQVYTCQASNYHLATPISSPVLLDMNLRPLSVRILGQNLPLSAEKNYEISCEVVGARPTPHITWWKGDVQLKNSKETMSQDQNVTISTLSFVPSISDSGATLRCRGASPKLSNYDREDSWQLVIFHVPVVTLELGSSLNASALRESADVYFECSIRSNPWVTRVVWRHNHQPLIHNASAGTIISNQSLVLQSISRARAGMYTCAAINQEGEGESNAVHLDIKFKPVCRPGQQRVWGIGRGETATIPCDVEANPDNVHFRWRLNNSAESVEIPASRHTADRARSFLQHTPQSDRDFGALLCWGDNSLGTQDKPCVFHIIPAGKPDTPVNCSLVNQTSESLTLVCFEGFDGGLRPQEFMLELYDAQSRALVSNITARVPVFTVAGLESGLDFNAELYAFNLKGRSEPVRMHAYTLKGAERRTAATHASLQITPLLGLLVGLVSALVLAAVLIVVVLRMRGRGEGHDEKGDDGRRVGDSSKNATISANTGTKDGVKGDGDQGGDENNPDLIPDKSDDYVDPDEKAFEYLNDRRLYSALNPRLGLYSPATIDHVTPGIPNGPTMATMDAEVTYAELSLQRPHVDQCLQRVPMAPSPQQPLAPSLVVPLGGGVLGESLGGPLGPPMGMSLCTSLGVSHGNSLGAPLGLMGPYGGPGSAMTLPHPGHRGTLPCIRRPPHEPTMYAQIAVCRGSSLDMRRPPLGNSTLKEDIAGEAVDTPLLATEHRESSVSVTAIPASRHQHYYHYNAPSLHSNQISSLQPLLETRCNTIGGHGKSGLGGAVSKPPAVTATRF